MPVIESVDKLLEQLTVADKINLTSGLDNWATYPVPELGVPSIRTSDGPNGLRGGLDLGAACLPAPTGLGSTWNKDLIYRVGEFLSTEAKAKASHVALAPTVNIQRSPLGGRGFESFSEDPVLSGTLAAAYINGLQDNGIAATIKHFVCNDQEDERRSVNSIVTERALREIYLRPFQIAVRDSHPRAFMTGYNKLNGIHCSENVELLEGILRGEWGWRGLVMSDWAGTYSTSDSINAGLDLEMPGPTKFRGGLISHDLLAKEITSEKLDERVRNVLELIQYAQEHSGIPEDAVEKPSSQREAGPFLREVAAESVVLLENEKNILPLKKDTSKIAVIGPNANVANYSGGGSASFRPAYTVTPYDAIVEKVSGGEKSVSFSLGAYSHKLLPVISENVKSVKTGKNGFDLTIFSKAAGASDRKLLKYYHSDDSFFHFNEEIRTLNDGKVFFADIEGIFTPTESGIYDFGVCVFGTAQLFIDGKLLVDVTDKQVRGSFWYTEGSEEVIRSIQLEAGKSYKITVQYGGALTMPRAKHDFVSPRDGNLVFGALKKTDSRDLISQAVELASKSEQVIIITGLNKEWESEGYDRSDMRLPHSNDELIEAVLEVNPNAVIVIQSGTPVEMPWADKASTIIYTSFGGNETGNGLADVIFGDVNPSGRLPLSFPEKLSDAPSFLNFGAQKGRVLYGEDIFVGYRFYETVGRKVRFPFGYGLSYTNFELSNLGVKINEDKDELKVSLTVKNVGKLAGADVIQLYISQKSPSVLRPVRELRGFTKVSLKAGEKKKVEIDVSLKYATSFWDEIKKGWVSEKDNYLVTITDSPIHGTELVGDFEISKTFKWLGV